MRVHYLQHVPFEGPASIASVLKQNGHKLTSTKLYNHETLPSITDMDWLIVMGGPMGIYDQDRYSWLIAEKKFIKDAILSNKIVLGICLGAQLIAEALGAKVYKNKFQEIGWFNIRRSSGAATTILSKAIPNEAEVLHWHGDTFDIPAGATPLARSAACQNQGFIMDDRVVALQFHLETTCQSAKLLIENCRNELDGSQYVQTENEILSNPQRFLNINKIMVSVLTAMETRHA